MTFLDKIVKDLPEQFKNKKNLEVFFRAFSRQADEIAAMFEQLRTERNLQNAIGKQLNGNGDIVVLSRAEAARMFNESDMELSDDEKYRKYLIFKAHYNTNRCTYEDFIYAFQMFWDRGPIYYSENPAHPATIIITTNEMLPEENAADVFNVPVAKAGGVGLIRRAVTKTPIPAVRLNVVACAHNPITVTHVPYMIRELSFELDVTPATRAESITITKLPYLED